MYPKIVVNSNRTEAKLYFEHKTMSLYHSEGKVLDLVAWLLLPVESTHYDITWTALGSSQDETQSINLSEVA